MTIGIGSSIMRDVAEYIQLEEVRAIPGGTISRNINNKNISSSVVEAVEKEEDIILQFGNNDLICSQRKAIRSQDLVADYLQKVKAILQLRIRSFKNKGSLIFILLLPRYLLTNIEVTKQIIQINRALRKIIQEVRTNGQTGIKWVNTESLISPCFFKKDQCHLTNYGNRKLAELIKEQEYKLKAKAE